MAVFRSPGDLVIVACATEFTVHYVCHQYIVSASAHFKAQLGVAYTAAEAYAMEPVREDYRPHPRCFRKVVEYDIAIFGMGGCGGLECEQRQQGSPAQEETCKKLPTVIFHIEFHYCFFAGTANDERGALWQRLQSVGGNATAPWQRPQNSPLRIASMVIWLAPA